VPYNWDGAGAKYLVAAPFSLFIQGPEIVRLSVKFRQKSIFQPKIEQNSFKLYGKKSIFRKVDGLTAA